MMAVPMTVVTSTENWARLRMPAFSPYSDEIVPNVRPVLINSVVYQASRATYRRANGYTPTNLAMSLIASSAASQPRLVTTAGSEMFIPDLRKKNGVSSAKATTRSRRC